MMTLKSKNRNSIFLLLLTAVVWSCNPKEAATPTVLDTEASEKLHDKKLRHLVLFAFKDETSKESINQVMDSFTELPLKIPEIAAFEWGTNVSPENLNKGYTHSILLTFNSEKDRDLYLPHPDHEIFGALAGPYLKEVLVVDYWIE